MSVVNLDAFTLSKAILKSIIRRKSTLFSSFILPIVFIYIIWWISPEMPLEVELLGGDKINETFLNMHLITGALNAIALTSGLFGFLISFENKNIFDRVKVAGFSSLTVNLGGFIALSIVLLLSSTVAAILTISLYFPEDLIGFVVSLFLITLIYAAIGHILGKVYPRILEGTLIILLFSFIDLMMITNPIGKTVYLKTWTYVMPGFWPMQILLRSSFDGYNSDIIWMSLLSIGYLVILLSLVQSPPLFRYIGSKIKSLFPKKRLSSRGLLEMTSASWKNIARERAAMGLIIFFPVLIVLMAAVISAEGTFPLTIDGKVVTPDPSFQDMTIVLFSMTAIAFVSSIVSFILSFQMKSIIPRLQVMGYPIIYLNIAYIIVTVIISSIVTLIVSLFAFFWIEPSSIEGFMVSLFFGAITYALIGLIIANISKTKEIGLYLILTLSFIDTGFLQNPSFSKRTDEDWMKYMPGSAPGKMITHATFHTGTAWVDSLGILLIYQLVLVAIYILTSNRGFFSRIRSGKSKYSVIAK